MLLIVLFFLFLKKNKTASDLFLGGLLLVLSIRIGKSVFFYFNPQLSKTYLQIGLPACFLIGILLYFFVKSKLQNLNHSLAKYSIILLILGIGIFGFFYPYVENIDLWGKTMYRIINIQWLIFIVLSIYEARLVFKKIFASPRQLNADGIWILSIIGGVLSIWLSYYFAKYTSFQSL